MVEFYNETNYSYIFDNNTISNKKQIYNVKHKLLYIV